MRALRRLAIGIGGLLGVVVLAFAVLQMPPGQRAAAALISEVSSGPDGGLDIVGLSGFFPADLHITSITYRDREGPWLTAENVRLRWSITSLLRGPLQVEALSAERVEVLRPPLPDKAKAAGDGGGRPQLPIGVELRALTIDDLHLATTLLPVESHWKVVGNATAPADLSQGRVVLNAERIDGPMGRLAADLRFDAGQRTVDGEVSLSEGRGGIVAALLQRPDIGDLSMRLVARGDAHSGQADLTVSAGDAARATGKANWEPRDGATAVSLQLHGAAPGAPRGRWGDVMRGPIVFKADGVIDDKVVTVSKATLSGGTLGLEAAARYDRPADRLEATATVRADEPGALGSFMGGVMWRGLQVDAKASVSALATKPQGTIALTGKAEDISLAALDARVPAIGGVTLRMALDVGDGKITVTSFDLGSALASAKGGGSYLPATQKGEAKVTVALPSLAPLSALAQTPLAGKATVDLTATADPDGLTLAWQGTVNDLEAAGLPADLITAAVDLSGAATWRRDEVWTLSDARVKSEGASFGLSGQGRGTTGDLDLSLDLPTLGVLQSDLAGSARLSGNIKLRSDGTDLQLAAELSDIKRGQLSAPRLSLSASATLDAAGTVHGTITANGDAVGQTLSLEGRFERDTGGGVVVPTLQGRWASVVLDVSDLAVTAARTSGYGRLRIEHLHDLTALAGTELGGSLDVEVTADNRATNGRVTVRVQGTDVRSGTFGIGALEFRATIDEPMTTGTTDATLTANRIAGVAEINRLQATAKGDRRSLDIALQTSGPRTNANLSAKAELSGDELVIGLTRFEGSHAGIPVSLAAPTRFHINGARIGIEPTNLRLGGGRLSARGTLETSGASDLQVELAALPLSLLDAVTPGTNLDGTVQGKFHVTGAIDAPIIDGTYSATGLRLRRPEAALLPPLSLQGSGKVMGRQASIDARLGTGGATSLALKGKATLPSGRAALSGSASIVGTIDLAPFAPLLGNDIRNVAGTLRPDLTLEIAGPRITGRGAIDFSNGTVSLPESGLRLSNGEGRLVLQGDTLQIQRLSFQSGRGGGVSASGSLRLDAQQGVVPDLSVTSRNALLVSRPDLVASVSSNLKVSGSTVGGITVSGPVTIDRADIAVGAQQSADYPTLDVREVNKPGEARATQPASTKPSPRTAPPPGATPIRLALTISAPQAVFVRGRGLDAEMAGKVDVGGTPAAPTAVGGLTLRRGEFTLLGRRLNFSRGVVTLDNLDRIDPRLDFVASTTVQSTTVNVNIGGTSRAPTVTVTSVPSLPADEAMALLLFGKPASGLSAFELAQAAQGLAELTGRSPGTGVLSRLRNGLGLDRLSVGSGSSSITGSNGSTANSANAPMTLEAGRYVAPGVYVGARQSAAGGSSRGVVQVDVLEHVKIEGDVGANSTGRVGVKLEWDY